MQKVSLFQGKTNCLVMKSWSHICLTVCAQNSYSKFKEKQLRNAQCLSWILNIGKDKYHVAGYCLKKETEAHQNIIDWIIKNSSLYSKINCVLERSPFVFPLYSFEVKTKCLEYREEEKNKLSTTTKWVEIIKGKWRPKRKNSKKKIIYFCCLLSLLDYNGMLQQQ